MPPPVKRSRFKRSLGSAFGVGFLCLGFCGIGGFFLVVRTVRDDSAKLPSDLELARQRGLPLTPEDIESHIAKVPASENAAPLYRMAIDTYKRVTKDTSAQRILQPLARPSIRMGANEALIRPSGGIRNWRAENRQRNALFRPVFEIVKRAVKLRGCNFNTDYAKAYKWFISTANVFSDQVSLQRIAYGIGSIANQDAIDGKIDEALDDAETLILMARQAEPYGELFQGSWPVIAYGLALESLSRILLRHWKKAGVLDRVDQLASSIRLPNLYNFMQTDFVLGIEAIHHIKSLEDIGLDRNTPKAFSKTVDALYQSPSVRDAFEAKFIHIYLQYFSSLPTDNENWPAIHKSLRQIRRALDSDYSVDIGIARILTPAYPGIALMYGSTQAEQRLVLTAAQLLRTEVSSGRFPAALMPKLKTSIDPFSGKPLRYVPASNGFKLYSVGRNMRDDGGRPRFGPDSNGSDDIVFNFQQRPTTQPQ